MGWEGCGGEWWGGKDVEVSGGGGKDVEVWVLSMWI